MILLTVQIIAIRLSILNKRHTSWIKSRNIILFTRSKLTLQEVKVCFRATKEIQTKSMSEILITNEIKIRPAYGLVVKVPGSHMAQFESWTQRPESRTRCMCAYPKSQKEGEMEKGLWCDHVPWGSAFSLSLLPSVSDSLASTHTFWQIKKGKKRNKD